MIVVLLFVSKSVNSGKKVQFSAIIRCLSILKSKFSIFNFQLLNSPKSPLFLIFEKYRYICIRKLSR